MPQFYVTIQRCGQDRLVGTPAQAHDVIQMTLQSLDGFGREKLRALEGRGALQADRGNRGDTGAHTDLRLHSGDDNDNQSDNDDKGANN